MKELQVKTLYEEGHSLFYEYLLKFQYPWEALSDLSREILKVGEMLSPAAYEKRGEDVWVSKEATVSPSAFIMGPAIICKGAHIGHCAYLRGSVVVGENANVGNSTELKNAILFDRVEVPHFNYVGDSVLGYHAHLGAGAVTSNVKSDREPVSIRCGEQIFPTGRKKVGAFLGDFAEVGCNSVLNPGTVVGKGTRVYPLSSVRGYVPPHHIYKSASQMVEIE